MHGNGLQNCYLKSTIRPRVQRDFVIDSAILLPDDVLDDCDKLGSEINTAGQQFKLYCGQDYPYNDLALEHAKSMKECMGLCAGKGNVCAGISYLPAMDQAGGYWNCYLKSATGLNGLKKTTFKADSAFVLDLSRSMTTTLSSLPPLSSVKGIVTLSSLPPVSSGGATTPTDLNMSTGLSTSRSGGTSLAKGAIAGIALGTLVGTALLVFACGLIYRRRRQIQEKEAVRDSPLYHPSATYHGPQERGGSLVAPIIAELPSSREPEKIAELPASEYPRV
jgi:hypothetical protein